MAAAESYPDDLRYHPEHDWARVDGRRGRARASPGSRRTRSASSSTTSRPRSAPRVTKDQSYGEVESVKAVSDLISPLSGEVLEVNQAGRRRAGDGERRPLRRGLADPDPALRSVGGRLAARRRGVPRARSPSSELPLRSPTATARRCSRRSASRRSSELFEQVPAGVRLGRPLDLEPALSELELVRHLEELAAKNAHTGVRAVVPRRRHLRPLRPGRRRRGARRAASS